VAGAASAWEAIWKAKIRLVRCNHNCEIGLSSSVSPPQVSTYPSTTMAGTYSHTGLQRRLLWADRRLSKHGAAACITGLMSCLLKKHLQFVWLKCQHCSAVCYF